MRSKLAAWGCLLVLVACSPGVAGEWGHLAGRIVFDGELPSATSDSVASKASTSHRDRSLLVDSQSRGIANVVIYLWPPRGQDVPEHPSYRKTRAATVEWKMEQMQFVPRVLLLRTTQTMVQRNLDKKGHNAHIAFIRNAPM